MCRCCRSGCMPTTWMMSYKPASGGQTPGSTRRKGVMWGRRAPRYSSPPKPTTKKAGKDKYPFKQPHLDTLRYVVDTKPDMALPNYSLTGHSPYRWRPELMGLTTPVLMESGDAVLPLPTCHALPRIGTSEPVKQVEIFREANEESGLGHATLKMPPQL